MAPESKARIVFTVLTTLIGSNCENMKTVSVVCLGAILLSWSFVKILAPSQTHVVIIESVGGLDKGSDGFRKDTIPLQQALEQQGCRVSILKFLNSSDSDGIFHFVKNQADVWLSRVDPGQWDDRFDAAAFDVLLNKLRTTPVLGFPAESDLKVFGSKRILELVRDTPIGLEDTFIYRNASAFVESFPKTISSGERVIKRSGGAMGFGVWRVSNIGAGMVRVQEAADNHVDMMLLQEFVRFCRTSYLQKGTDFIVDQRYLPRISEGEIRIIWISDHPIKIVHRKPGSTESFSAALGSGARHIFYDPWQPEFSSIVSSIVPEMHRLRDKLNVSWPLIWTSDFIMSDTPGKVAILGEINASCVGFSSNPDFAEILAKELISKTRSAKKKEIVAH
jgi:hypothetical protein